MIQAAQIDQTNRSFFPAQNAANAAAIPRGSDLYAFLQNQIAATFDAYKSTDGGANWTIQDHANAPGGVDGAVWFDGSNTAWVVWVIPNGGPQNQLAISSYDMATDAWTAPITGGPQCQTVNAIFRRPDNTFVILYDAGNPITPGKSGSSRLWFVVYDGVSFIADSDLGVSAIPENLYAYIAASAMDTAGRVHVAFENFSYSKYYYQAIEPDNTLGTFSDLTSLGPFAAKYNGPPLGSIAVSTNRIIIGAVVGTIDAVVLVGDSLTAPTWTLSTVDSTYPPTAGPAVCFDSSVGAFGMVFKGADTVAGITRYIRTAQTNNIANPTADWVSSAFYDVTAGPTPADYDGTGFSDCILSCFDANGYISVNYFTTGFFSSGMFVGPFALTGPTPPAAPGIVNLNPAAFPMIPLPDPKIHCD